MEREIEESYEADLKLAQGRRERNVLSPDSYTEHKDEALKIRRELLVRVRLKKFEVRMLLQCLDVSLLASQAPAESSAMPLQQHDEQRPEDAAVPSLA